MDTGAAWLDSSLKISCDYDIRLSSRCWPHCAQAGGGAIPQHPQWSWNHSSQGPVSWRWVLLTQKKINYTCGYYPQVCGQSLPTAETLNPLTLPIPSPHLLPRWDSSAQHQQSGPFSLGQPVGTSRFQWSFGLQCVAVFTWSWSSCQEGIWRLQQTGPGCFQGNCWPLWREWLSVWDIIESCFQHCILRF